MLQIQEGESCFGDVASHYSEGPEKTTRGVVGPVTLTSSHPIITEVLKSAEKNKIYGPIRVSEWNVLIRLEHMMPAIYNQQTEILMSKELFEESLKEEIEMQLRNLNKIYT